jgi:glycosyltransferase involved in cell wall biosynthesis
MKLSVIIPCLNRGATLGIQLEALSTQKWSEPWELILSDNGSTDNSVDIAHNYMDRIPVFKIIDASARRGGPYALNMGVKAASAEKIACCDADDEVAPGWVAAMESALSKHDVVCGQFKFEAHEAICVTPHRMRRKSRVTSLRLCAHSCTARY